MPALLVYGDSSGCDRNRIDDVAEFGGRPCDPDAFDRSISEPGTVAFLGASFVLLLVALAVIHRGADAAASGLPADPSKARFSTKESFSTR